MRVFKSKKFSRHEDLAEFVNSHHVNVEMSITSFTDGSLVLWYWEG